MRWQKSDFETHGYTSMCVGCRAISRRVAPKSHSEACRNRLEQLLRDSEEGLRLKNLAGNRIHQRIAEKLEESNRSKIKTRSGAPGPDSGVAVDRGGF